VTDILQTIQDIDKRIAAATSRKGALEQQLRDCNEQIKQAEDELRKLGVDPSNPRAAVDAFKAESERLEREAEELLAEVEKWLSEVDGSG